MRDKLCLFILFIRFLYFVHLINHSINCFDVSLLVAFFFGDVQVFIRTRESIKSQLIISTLYFTHQVNLYFIIFYFISQ